MGAAVWILQVQRLVSDNFLIKERAEMSFSVLLSGFGNSLGHHFNKFMVLIKQKLGWTCGKTAISKI